MVKLTPTEQKVYNTLLESPKRPIDIANELSIPPSSVSRHLSLLFRLDMVSFEEEPGNQKVYSVLGGGQ